MEHFTLFRSIRLFISIFFILCLSKAEIFSQQQTKIYASDGSRWNNFGQSIDVAEDWMAVGSRYRIDTATNYNTGAVYLYHQEDGSWAETQILAPHDSSDLSNFGQFGYSVDIFGEWLAVGADASSIGPHDFQKPGAVYLYRLDTLTNEWNFAQNVFPENFDHYMKFGTDVAIYDNWLVVGAPGSNNGQAFLYEYNGTEWRFLRRFRSSLRSQDNFGSTVELWEKTLVVGENYDHVFIYEFTDGTWENHIINLGRDDLSTSIYNLSISLRRDKLLIGLREFSSFPVGAYLYKKADTGWVRERTFLDTDIPNERLGGYVFLADSLLAIGSLAINPTRTTISGLAYYKLEGSSWEFQQQLFPPDITQNLFYGEKFYIHDKQIYVGAIGGEGRVRNSGVVYQVDLSSFLPVVTTSFDDGVGSLRDVVSRAQPGDSISFSFFIQDKDTIKLNTGIVEVDKDLFFKGDGRINISGTNQQNIFHIKDSTTVDIRGVNFSNGFSSKGGAILNEGTLTVKNAQFVRNEAEYGGGIHNKGMLVLESTIFANNQATLNGGAILNDSSGNLQITYTKFEENQAQMGGSIFQSNEAILQLSRSSISHSSATQKGGGIYSQGNSFLNHSTLGLNQAEQGGAIYTDGITALQSMTITQNTASIDGGGIYNVGEINLQNSVITENEAQTSPDIFNQGDLLSNGYNFLAISDSTSLLSSLGDTTGTSNSPIDPLLDSLQDIGGLALGRRPLNGSPLINTGFDADSLDQRGFLRDEMPDKGAVELVCDYFPIVTNNLIEGPGSLPFVIANACPGATVTFADSLSGDTIKLDGEFITIDKNLIIDGSDVEDLTIDADFKNRIFLIDTGNEVVIKGLKLIKGNRSWLLYPSSNQTGGAIRNLGQLRVENCIFMENAADQEGGAIAGGPKLEVENCQFIRNGSVPNISFTTFGIIVGKDVFINNSYFEGNSAGRGTILHSYGGDKAVLRNSTVVRNSGQEGFGGIIYHRGNLSIINSTFTENHSAFSNSSSGSMIANEQPTAVGQGRITILNSTLVNNRLTALNIGCAVTLGNNIIANNRTVQNIRDIGLNGATSTDGDSAVISLGHNIIGITDGYFPLTKASDQIGTVDAPINPYVDSVLRDNGGPTPTLALLPESPAIDAGNSGEERFDQRGVERIGIADIGAYEFGCKPGAAVNTLDDSGPGSLREAITLASPGDTLRFSGCFVQDTIQLSSSLIIDKDLVIFPDRLGQVIIRGDSGFSMVHIEAGKTVSFHHTIFHHSQSQNGGAVYNEGQLALVRSHISETKAINGGAIFNTTGSDLQIDKSHIFGVGSQKGGAIYNEGNTIFTNGAITFAVADSGGAIFNNGNYLLHNSTLALDSAAIGGAIFHQNGGLEISSSTISENAADSISGGVYALGNVSSQNSIIANNTAPSNPDISLTNSWNSLGHNLIGIFPDGGFNTLPTDILGSQEMPIDPLLQSLRDNGGLTPTLAPFGCSPAVDLGNAANEIYDQRGIERKFPVDIGAFDGEAIYESGNIVTNTNPGGFGSLRYTIEQAQSGDTIWVDECLAGRYIDLGTGNIQIDKDLIIMGPTSDKTVLYMSEGLELFTVSFSSTVHMQNLIFSGTSPNSQDTANTFIFNYHNLSLFNCEFMGSNDRAILNTGRLEVDSCKFMHITGEEGTAIYSGSSFAKVNIRYTQFVNNESQVGLINNAGELFIDSSYFSRNRGRLGAIVYNYGEGARLSIQNTTLENNFSDRELIYNGSWSEYSYTQISHTQFLNNSLKNRSLNALLVNHDHGKMVVNETFFDGSDVGLSNPILSLDSLIIKNSTFWNNTQEPETISINQIPRGGGITIDGGYASIENSTFDRNSAFTGGAILILFSDDKVEINSCTIVRNEAHSSGGIYLVTGELSIQNTIVALNTASNTAPDFISTNGTVISDGYNLIGNASNNFPTNNPTDILGITSNPINPLLAPLNENGGSTPTVAILPNSPAIDAGNSAPLTLDQRGLPRDTYPDIGAYEFGSSLTCTFAYWEAGEQTDCNDTTGTYLQHIKLYYFSPPDSSTIILTWANDSISDSIRLDMHQSPLDLSLNIPINSGSWSISGWFETDPSCSFEADSFFVAPEGCIQPDPVPIYRVNAGGIEMTDSLINWSIDKQNTPSPYVNASASNNTTGWDGDQNFDNSTYAPTKLFGTHRWDGSWGEEMSWAFPVENGDYIVNLFFAENKSNSASVGARVFDVLVENNIALDHFDVYAVAGFRVSNMQSIETSVGDGMLNIDLQRVVGNPFVSGIEILSLNPQERKKPLQADFNIYPNPASNTLTLAGFSSGSLNIDIFDMSGKRVMSLEGQAQNKYQMNISQLPPGLYEIFITNGNKMMASKFMIAR